MAEPITAQKQIKPGWLTDTLHENGHLSYGRVTSVKKEGFTTHFSQIWRLKLVYSGDAAPQLPTSMLLKSALPDIDGSLNMGKVEVSAYLKLAQGMIDPPIVRCFDATHSEQSNRSHILMEDLSTTHFQPELPIPPSRSHCELSVEALAQFHALGWKHPGLGTMIGQLVDAAALNEIVRLLVDGLAGIGDYLGDRLSTHRRQIYERALDFMPGFWERRLRSIQRNTLIHGDAHLWNFLHPRDT